MDGTFDINDILQRALHAYTGLTVISTNDQTANLPSTACRYSIALILNRYGSIRIILGTYNQSGLYMNHYNFNSWYGWVKINTTNV